MATKTIKFGSVFGNFKWEAEAEINDQLIDALLPLGALQVGQRSPSTAAEKELANKLKLYTDKRPTGFRRDTIPFSQENADILAKHIGSMKVEVGRNEKDEPIYANLEAVVTVEAYDGAQSADSKFTAERKKYVQRCKEGKGSTLGKNVGYEGPIGDGTFDGAPMDFLVAIRTWVRAQADAL